MFILPAHSLSTLDVVHCLDALALLRGLRSGSVDAVITDPPYNVTACTWETDINLTAFWQEANRVLVPDGVTIITSTQPFTSRVVMSNPRDFRYEWIWEKSQGTGYLNANRIPMKSHENILLFYHEAGRYFPQMEKGERYSATSGAVGGFVRDKTVGGYLTINNGFRYPKTVLRFTSDTGLHPTQKPLALMEYLILTYTRPGDLIVDPFAGSGTTLIAARNLNRHYIGGDIMAEYVDIARKRLAEPYTLPMFEQV